MQQIELEPKADGAVRDAPAELAALRRELARCRGILDSTRLIVGHEFAKPLTAASGYLELLEEYRGAALDERERGYIAKIRAAFARLNELIDSFVEMLRLEHEGDDARTLERIDVRALVEAVRERLGEDAARITANVPAALPPVVGRRRCIEVVLENLVSNAVIHGEGRPVAVTASLERDCGGDSGKSLLILAVQDRGAGIPGDKLDDIFKPFYRIENGERRSGLGLGLALVKSVVNIIKGDIHVTSKEGDGTTVTVTVPVEGDGTLISDTVG